MRRLIAAAFLAVLALPAGAEEKPNGIKWFLVLLYSVGLPGSGPMTSVAIGPYETGDQCVAIRQLATKEGWRGFCYPVGDIPLKKPDAPKVEDKAKAKKP